MSDVVASFRFVTVDPAARIARFWEQFRRQRLARRTLRLLAEMDDRGLADIGASRSHAVWEGSRPVWDRFNYRDPA